MGTWVQRGLLTGLLLFTTSACSILTPSSKASAGLREADRLVTTAEELHVECELTRLRGEEAWQSLLGVLQRPWPDGPETAYLQLVEGVTTFEQQAAALELRAKELSRSAPGFFRDWELRSRAIRTESLRQVADQRRGRSQAQLERSEQALLPARASLTQASQALRDLATFLEHDFNDGSLKVVEGEARRLRPLLDRMGRELHQAEDALRVFVRRTAPQLEAELELLSQSEDLDTGR